MIAEHLSLQIRCFDAPLQPQALKDVKFIVQKNVESGVQAAGLTLEGTCGCGTEPQLLHVI